jgi:two-component system chemotaxis response regulator CheY
LIVDDNEVIRLLLNHQLEDVAERHLAADGYEALSLFGQALEQGRPFDLVLMDLQMPGMNGIEAIAAIQDLERQKGATAASRCRIVIQSAYPDLMDQAPIVDAVLTKPVSMPLLLRTIRDLGLDAPGPVPAA